MASGKKKSSANVISIANMKPANHESPLFAGCVSNTEYPASLELHKIYRVIADDDAAQDGDLRAIDESGEDYLYRAERFAMLELRKR